MSRKRKKGQITSVILKTIEAAGVASVAMLAPNVLKTLEKLNLTSTSLTNDRVYIKTATTRLKGRGLITFGKRGIKLTEKGKEELAKYQLREYKIAKPRFWDGKYRILVFDIKEERRSTRDRLRRELQNLGFYMIQQSVWVHPYNCEDLIILLKSHLKLGKDVIYMIVERIQNDKSIKKHFDLP